MSASTQNQALSALLFLFRELLELDVELEGVVRTRTRKRLPVVLTPEEVRAVLERMDGVEALVAGLLYGSGLRLLEALRLRVQDLDFSRKQLTARDGKGSKDRRTLLPTRVGEKLGLHLEKVRRLHQTDLAEGYGRVQLPHALGRKYPNAAVEWSWQWVFPQTHRWTDPALTARHKSENPCNSMRLSQWGGQGAMGAWGCETNPIPSGSPDPAPS
ncbi:tyrosine-type recombinase/integrase [Synechococcus sp. RedBA-s]|uniref:tyrosine-type recombinase/integrase n=1 Tax=Synechococcus sp. RedBA-s TaxID=2823741 RepID=UPI0020CBA87D|nr:tyrosine-type recombinase/integrase [Synechococcus sp. RedBA-s]MCP9801285.1 tyrosine-type recombinase/integrase [Synechococcus sp. RedBA-s]